MKLDSSYLANKIRSLATQYRQYNADKKGYGKQSLRVGQTDSWPMDNPLLHKLDMLSLELMHWNCFPRQGAQVSTQL